MKSQRVKLNGLQHQVYLWGSSRLPKLFLFHGWLDTGAGFDFLVQFLQKRFHCIAPDLRGYGFSAHTPNALGYFFYEYVADLHRLFNEFSPDEPLRILGHSMGGAVATAYAGTFPERVTRLINVEGFQLPDRKPDQAPPKARYWIEQNDAQRFRAYPSLKEFGDRLRVSNPNLAPKRALFLAKHLAKKNRKGWIMAADPKHKLPEPYLISLDIYQAFIDRIQAPCLWVASDYTEKEKRFSVFDDPRMQRREPQRLPPGSKKLVIPDCGHMVHHERPEALAEAILPYLSDAATGLNR